MFPDKLLKTKNETYTRFLILWIIIIGSATILITAHMILQQTVSDEALKKGDTAPDFKLVDSEKGNILTKQNFKGKPLFIFFTTT